MKKIIFTVLALVGLSTLSFSQCFRYGPKVGLNLSNISVDKIGVLDIDKDMRTSIHFGGFVKYELCSWMALQAELLYSMQGAKLKWSDGTDKYDGKLKLNYLTVPILAKFYMYEGLFGEIGPQCSFLLKKSIDGGLKDKAAFRNFDFDVALGLGYELDFGLMAGARYVMGAVNVFKDVDSHKVSSKNGVVQIYAAWMF